MRGSTVVSRLDDLHRDAAGNKLDPDQWDRLIGKEYEAIRPAGSDLHVERYIAPENPELIAFRVVDESGHVRGFIGFEMDAMEWDLPQRTLERVQRAALPRPDIRLVG